MKSARMLTVLINLLLIAGLAFAGLRFYTHLLDSDQESNFFKEHEIPNISDLGELIKNKPKARGPKYSEYQISLETLAKPPEIKKEVVVEEDDEEKISWLNVKVLSVVFDKNNPRNSGAHILANNNIPRFFAVGDNQVISDSQPYYLIEVTEDQQDSEYTLIFQDTKGNKGQSKYQRK